MTDQDKTHAKVFISIGQKPKEVQIAKDVSLQLEQLGYETYVAIRAQTLRSLKQNIFNELETSEYLLFIDLKLEQISDGHTFRGSLFCHQELAVASYLNMPVVALHEKGVEQLNGMSGALQLNSIPFSDREHVQSIVVAEVQKAGWDANWKNELSLTIGDHIEVSIPASPPVPSKMARWYGIPVTNRHRRKPAVNCYVYLERAKALTGEPIRYETAEGHWCGYTHPNALIGPQASRRFDAFYVFHENPTKCIVPTHTGSSLFIPVIVGVGDFELTYAVYSENFPIARGTFDLHIGTQLDEILLRPQCGPRECDSPEPADQPATEPDAQQDETESNGPSGGGE